jgi:hypothetical protein
VATWLKRIFGECWHRNYSFPITPLLRRVTQDPIGNVLREQVSRGRTYVTCLDCGAHFAYDWQSMTVGERLDRSPRRLNQTVPVAPLIIVPQIENEVVRIR